MTPQTVTEQRTRFSLSEDVRARRGRVKIARDIRYHRDDVWRLGIVCGESGRVGSCSGNLVPSRNPHGLLISRIGRQLLHIIVIAGASSIRDLVKGDVIIVARGERLRRSPTQGQNTRWCAARAYRYAGACDRLGVKQGRSVIELYF